MSTDSWTFVTNHTRVLVRIAQQPDVRARELATVVGITERAAQRIVADLVEAGYINRRRVGRRNHYTVNRDRPMRRDSEREHEIGKLLDILG